MKKTPNFYLLSIILLAYLCLPNHIFAQKDTTANVATRIANSLKVGFLLQTQATYIQDRPQVKNPDENPDWGTQLQLWRANILLTGKVNDKTGFFVQTTVLNPIGNVGGTQKNTQLPNFILLDAQIEHEISENAILYGGMQLVNINRQGLQAPGTLLGLDFGWYQYPHLFASGGGNATVSALQNNFGRDIGVNFRGYLLDEKLEVRAGVFRGGAINGSRSNLRGALRLNYNIFEEEKSHYYTGQSMGEKKTLAIGAGIDVQDDYMNIAGDVFLDLPLGLNDNALTWSTSVMQMTGGNSIKPNFNSFSSLIPNQTIYFSEIGFLFKELNLQPYIKYEGVQYNATDTQFQVSADRQNLSTLGVLAPNHTKDNFNTIMNASRWGVGVNYYFEGYNHNLKLQYENVSYGQRNVSAYTTQQGGEIKLQWTYFMF